MSVRITSQAATVNPGIVKPATDKPISPLRRRMIDDMTIRNLSPTTQRSYIHAVVSYSRYFGRSPDWTSPAKVEGFSDRFQESEEQ